MRHAYLQASIQNAFLFPTSLKGKPLETHRQVESKKTQSVVVKEVCIENSRSYHIYWNAKKFFWQKSQAENDMKSNLNLFREIQSLMDEEITDFISGRDRFADRNLSSHRLILHAKKNAR